MFPYSHFCIDIETRAGDPTDVERWARTEWSPDSRWKPTTIGERYLEALSKKREKLALLETSPIIAIAIQTEQDLRCIHCMKPQEPTAVGAGVVVGVPTERDLLIAFRQLLEAPYCSPETILVGHNVKRFDLPKLRGAYIRNGLRLPELLAVHDHPVFDSMIEYARRFRGLDEGLFISAADLMDNLGISHHKGLADGAQIQDLYDAGKFDEIAAYALLDAQKEYEVFLRMTGQVISDEPLPVNGQAVAPSALSATLRNSIADQFEKQIEAAASLGDLAKLFRALNEVSGQVSEAERGRLTRLCEDRESQLVGRQAQDVASTAPSLNVVSSRKGVDF